MGRGRLDREVLQYQVLADTLAEGGLRHARDYFDWARITNLQLRFYEATVGVILPNRQPVGSVPSVTKASAETGRQRNDRQQAVDQTRDLAHMG